MKTITQESTITFSAIDFKDAVKCLALMDTLVEAINSQMLLSIYKSLPDEERKEYMCPSTVSMGSMTAEQINNAYQVLSALGFESQLEFLTEVTVANLQRNK